MVTRVFLAEDESIIRLDLREMLAEEGYEVVGETGRGDAVLALVRDLAPDLAILDVKMPGLDGLSVARQLADEALCGVIILTAFSQRTLIEAARDAGVFAYLVKPFQKSELIAAVEVAVARYRQMQALSQEVMGLSEQLVVRKVLDRAKGVLMLRHGVSEPEAFKLVQRRAMNDRTTMKAVAEAILAEHASTDGPS
jgi:two-component system, response regulator PdtaR